MTRMPEVVVIGAGVSGLVTAAALAHAGLPVTVLEAHIYPGGCAATFRHRGHWFDAGATLAAGFDEGGVMDLVGRATGVTAWPVRRCEPAMVVHLDDGTVVERHGDHHRWEVLARAFPTSVPFWRWQEEAARHLWAFALELPEPHPRTLREVVELTSAGVKWLGRMHTAPSLLLDLWRPIEHRLPPDARLRRFVDGQLLIAAQATSREVYSAYAAAALDLPNRGVVEVAGGIGSLSWALVNAVERHGGRVLFRQEVTQLRSVGRRWRLSTRQGLECEADIVVAAVTPWTLAGLLDTPPSWLRRKTSRPPDGWGAFVLYLSVDAAAVPPGIPLHHQVLRDGRLAEGFSVFVSLSPEWDQSRAPTGLRAATLSTHTRWHLWWDAFRRGPEEYRALVSEYTDRALETARRGLPWLPGALRFVLPGTPLSFARYTRRSWGWVGGFPQRHPFTGWPTTIAPELWLVGDSVFPGQSIPATALSGLRVARRVLRMLGTDLHVAATSPTLAPEAVPPRLRLGKREVSV